MLTVLFMAKNSRTASMCKLIGFSTILCISDEFQDFLIDSTTLWQELMMHHAIAIEENNEQNLHI